MAALFLFRLASSIHRKREWSKIDSPYDIYYNANEMRSSLMYLYSDIRPPLGEFAPDSETVKYLMSGECDIFLRPLKYANLIISCDLETGILYTGYSNIKFNDFFIETKQLKDGSSSYFANIKGEPYDGGNTLLREVIKISSDDLEILREQYLYIEKR
jgi:hypothetical protein